MSGNFESLENQLARLIENTREIETIVSDFQPFNEEKDQDALNCKINSVVNGLKELDEIKHEFQDVDVPFEVLKYIDEGMNPIIYPKESIEKASARNKEVKGKFENFQKFRTHLMTELNQAFPDTMREYQISRGYKR